MNGRISIPARAAPRTLPSTDPHRYSPRAGCIADQFTGRRRVPTRASRRRLKSSAVTPGSPCGTTPKKSRLTAEARGAQTKARRTAAQTAAANRPPAPLEDPTRGLIVARLATGGGSDQSLLWLVEKRLTSNEQDLLEERITWIFGSPRTGSTWLMQLLDESDEVVAV